MNIPNLKRMTAEEYVLWAQRQETGRYELIDGLVIEMNAERMDHMRVKARVANALDRQLRSAQIKGEVCWDGMALRIEDRTVHEPDAMLRLGEPLPGDAVVVTDPVIVVEVLSPSTGPIDTGLKLANYFTLESVQHYLVINTVKRVVQHFVRDRDGKPVMRPLIDEGAIDLSPPGLILTLDEIFEG